MLLYIVIQNIKLWIIFLEEAKRRIAKLVIHLFSQIAYILYIIYLFYLIIYLFIYYILTGRAL